MAALPAFAARAATWSRPAVVRPLSMGSSSAARLGPRSTEPIPVGARSRGLVWTLPALVAGQMGASGHGLGHMGLGHGRQLLRLQR